MLPEYREAREAALGRQVRALGGASPVRRPCLLRCGVRDRRPLSCRWRSGCSPVSAAKASRCAPQGRPGRFAGEFGDDLVGSAVEHLNDLGSNELLGRHMEPVGVALDGVEQPGGWVAEFAQQRGGGGGGVVAGEDLSAASRSGCGVRRCRVG